LKTTLHLSGRPRLAAKRQYDTLYDTLRAVDRCFA
jgi:hypothetical protein